MGAAAKTPAAKKPAVKRAPAKARASAGPVGKGLKGIRTIEAIVNPRSGSCNPQTAAELKAIFEELGHKTANVVSLGSDDMEKVLNEAKARNPDLVVILAGDGTARSAAEIFGPNGPLIAPLPGGTMNMLPRAFYGESDWRAAVREAITNGVERDVGGGELDGHKFYVAAMIGATALFAPAREAARERRIGDAFTKAKTAYRRAFAGRIRFQMEDGPEHKSQSVTLMCPMISKVMDDDDRWMEVAAIDPQNAAEAMRIGARVVISRLVGDWRDDWAVHVRRARRGRGCANFHIPALLDGEPVRLGRSAEFKFHPKAFRALAPRSETEDKV